VAAGGRFLDISARSGHDRGTLPVAAFDRGLDYAAIDLARLGRERPHEFRRIMTTVESLVVTAGVDSMGASTYPVTQVDQALQALTKDDHIGRVLVDLRQQRVPISRRLTVPIVRPDAGYLVTGGFGGFGLETLKWLVASGARNIAVLSRSGPVSEEAKETVRRLEADGARILVAELDISDGFRLAEAIRKIEDELPPLRGVIHSAAVIDDAALDVLQASQVERVMNPKAVGAWNLNRALANRDLDFFVCYSSITAMLGNAAQANYAAANAFLDGLVLYRRSRGLAGVSINWGVISDVGMVSRDARVEEHLQKLGLRGITSALALELLADALREQWVHVGVFDLDWQRWRRYVGGTPQGRFSRVLSPPDVGGDLAAEFRRRVITARPDERFQLAFTEVAEQVCRVLRIPSSRVDAETNLTDLGIDSLMATEVAAVFHERTGVRFRVLFIVRGPAIAEMARQIVEHVVKNAG
ncbi:MAG TPA: SDR family NAD(P)-dependent oxidoreductase, partial [Chloroflexota bacterium]